MRVRATVVSRPNDTRAVLDCGTKVVTSDQYGMPGYGHVLEYPEAAITGLSEEHGVVDLSNCRERPPVGEVVHVVPNHCCVVSNMVDELVGVRGDRVEVAWPVSARKADGTGRLGVALLGAGPPGPRPYPVSPRGHLAIAAPRRPRGSQLTGRGCRRPRGGDPRPGGGGRGHRRRPAPTRRRSRRRRARGRPSSARNPSRSTSPRPRGRSPW